jgi:voltage-gated potassium channel
VTVTQRLRDLYEGQDETAQHFRYALLAFDLVTIAFVVFTSFIERTLWIEIVDLAVGLIILADFCARVVIDDRRLRVLARPAAWADIAAIVSFLAPLAGEGLGFLRVLRTLRLLHTYQLLNRLRADFRYFREQEEVFLATAHLVIFLFVTTGLIYTLQHGRNPQIGNYADALYFTVTTLTTTGFGDITLEGTTGRMLSVGVMIVGVTLFLRLAQVMFRPTKVRHECQTCGLVLHDADAIHCKHCGETLRIRTEGTY